MLTEEGDPKLLGDSYLVLSQVPGYRTCRYSRLLSVGV